ncbi:MAG: DUF1189 family protein [Betaproteobacteria bacterium]
MKRYSMLHALFLSFFSRDLYRDVRANWKGTGFLYLLLLLAVTWLPIIYKIHGDLSEEIRQEVPKYLDQMPKITIAGGRVSIDRPVPYTILEPDGSTPFMVIDTSGRIISLGQTDATVLLTGDRIMFRRQQRDEVKIYDLTGTDASIDRDLVDRWVRTFGKYFGVVAYPVVLAGSFAYRFLQLMIYAAIGMVFVRKLRAPLDSDAVFRLAAVALTPAVVIPTLLLLAGIHVPASPIVFFAVAAAYLYYAVKVNA